MMKSDMMKIEDKIIKEIIKYNSCYAIRYYLDITDEFCNLFGNVVKQVKIELDEIQDLQYENELREIEEDMHRISKDMFNFVNIYLQENKIDLSGINIYVTFINGETLKFWNADCGGIEKV